LYYTNPVNAIIQRGKLRNSKFVVLLFVIHFSNISAITIREGYGEFTPLNNFAKGKIPALRDLTG